MKRILFALAIAIGLVSPACAQEDPITAFFNLLQPDPAPVIVIGTPRHHGYRSRAIGASPEVVALVSSVAAENGVSAAIAHAVVRKESGYNCHARNGAFTGIMQTSRQTARGMGVSGSLSDCRNSLEAGMRYLRSAIAMHGDLCSAISAYQSGLGVHRCSSYGRSVMAMMNGGSGVVMSGGRHHHRYASVHRHYHRYASR